MGEPKLYFLKNLRGKACWSRSVFNTSFLQVSDCRKFNPTRVMLGKSLF